MLCSPWPNTHPHPRTHPPTSPRAHIHPRTHPPSIRHPSGPWRFLSPMAPPRSEPSRSSAADRRQNTRDGRLVIRDCSSGPSINGLFFTPEMPLYAS